MSAESPCFVGLVLAVHGARIEKVDLLSPRIVQACHSTLYRGKRELLPGFLEYVSGAAQTTNPNACISSHEDPEWGRHKIRDTLGGGPSNASVLGSL